MDYKLYDFDNKSILRSGKRWFPTMGEIHYSRLPHKFWKEELCKMKAGGVDIASAYVIWIHHEEIEGEYDWSGDRNLHGFILAAKECGIKICLRIGPWCHGEVRNGGFPDWLLHKDFEPRTNDEKYFSVVEKWYAQIYEQVKDFICRPDDEASKDNPIIAVQIENEYGHCGGLYDESGDEHMKRLLSIAKKTGFNVYLYTATGWGGARTGGMIPVMGGYCDAPWDQRVTEIEPSGNYTFTYERNDHNIGSDHGFGYGITFDIKNFPYLTAELGGGLQVTSHRRTVATAKDIASVAVVKLGSGVNLLGYYMYHGGTNPEGKLSTLQESRETGYLNDLPVKNYDFRAPIGEFGVINQTFKELKLISYFTRDFGSELCLLDAKIPEENPLNPENITDLRFSYRTDGQKGYIFVNNYVRHHKMSGHDVELKSYPADVSFGKLRIKNGDFFFFPFNMNFCGEKIIKAFATPLCVLEKGSVKEKTVFYAREGEEKKSGFLEFEKQAAKKDRFLVLKREDALNSWKYFYEGEERIFICPKESFIFQNENGKLVATGRKQAFFEVYPELQKAPEGWTFCKRQNKNADSSLPEFYFAKYKKQTACEEGKIEFSKIESVCMGENSKYSLDLSFVAEKIGKNGISDCFVKFFYKGDSACLYGFLENGEKILLLDHFFMGEDFPWEIGLKALLEKKINLSHLELEIKPLCKNSKIYIEKWPDFDGEKISSVEAITYELEWKNIL